MGRFIALALLLRFVSFDLGAQEPVKKVFVLPIQGDIEEALVYVVKRGVKEAAEQKADALVLRMDTNGGKLDSTEEILQILQKFEPQMNTFTLIDTKAFSAGAFITAATRNIYMTPGSVIGAATPILATGESLPESVEAKTMSAVRGLVRAAAERHGHNTAVFDAMVDRTEGLTLDGKEIVPKGKILTLTTNEAEMSYGKPPKPLLSLGTVSSLEAMLEKAGLAGAEVIEFKESGFEQVARWIVKISPILLLIGIVGIYVEFKTPGFGLPGIGGAACLAIFFFGHYIAGLSGQEGAILFAFGLILVLVEILVLPGTFLPGLLGAFCMLAALLLAMVDQYPTDPVIPTLPQLVIPVRNLTLAVAGALLVAALIARYLPQTKMFSRVALTTVSGPEPLPSVIEGESGLTETPLRPAGKMRLNGLLADVVSTGDFIPAGSQVRVVRVEGSRIVVEAV